MRDKGREKGRKKERQRERKKGRQREREREREKNTGEQRLIGVECCLRLIMSQQYIT